MLVFGCDQVAPATLKAASGPSNPPQWRFLTAYYLHSYHLQCIVPLHVRSMPSASALMSGCSVPVVFVALRHQHERTLSECCLETITRTCFQAIPCVDFDSTTGTAAVVLCIGLVPARTRRRHSPIVPAIAVLRYATDHQ